MTDLTKWPLLVVRGERVTEEQANEILIRTNSYWPAMTNDKAWLREIEQLTGIISEDWVWEGKAGQDVELRMHRHNAQRISVEMFERSIQALNLNYLGNDRIASSWIMGPKGWCDWDGTIGCDNYNIGKWPDVESVAEDWEAIGKAFPFLRLRAQLFPEEGEVETPAVDFLLEDGKVHVDLKPTESIRSRNKEEMAKEFEDTVLPALIHRAFGMERGVDPDRLRAALDQVQAKFAESTS